MKIRIKFRKYGVMKFIGHLDVMRFFQKAIRRSGLDIVYTEGYSPHQVMSFAAPLGLGLTSDGEYMDIELHSSPEPAEALHRLNEQMVEGIEVVDYRMLKQQSHSAMSVVAAADYEISCRYRPASFFEDTAILEHFLNEEHILIEKKTKKSVQMVDIRPMVYSACMEFIEKKPVLRVRLAAGSSRNLKPELLLDALCTYAGCERGAFDYLIHRTELYADISANEEEVRSFVPLSAYETEAEVCAGM